MKAFVTGAAGFLGRHFTTELQARGWDVDGCDIRHGGDAITHFQHDHTVYDLVVHAAAAGPHRAAIDGQPHTHITNRHLDAAMFAWAIRTQQDRVLYLSSCAVLDEQPDAYGQVKLAGEQLAAHARASGCPVTVVRPYSGYGEDQTDLFPFGAFAARARRRDNPFEIWGDGQQVRDWIHVDDLVRAALAVAEDGTLKPVSLCTGHGVTMLDLATAMCIEAGYTPNMALRQDTPGGNARRVGDPTDMLRCYTPTVDLTTGIKRALALR